jgi:hypothetical protein
MRDLLDGEIDIQEELSGTVCAFMSLAKRVHGYSADMSTQ